MPSNCTTSWWAFPPLTEEVELDEKWSFVGKKQKNCDPDSDADLFAGDQWDHVAYDPEHRLVLAVIVGKRSDVHAELLAAEVRQRLGGRCPRLITSDGHPAYPPVIAAAFGEEITPEPTGRPGRPAGPRLEVPEELCYAVVEKVREGQTVVAVKERLVFGTESQLAEALAASAVSRRVNTSHLERQHGTDRHRNARKGRKTYRFSKDWEVHAAVTAYTMFSYNFCWCVRTLREARPEGGYRPRTPAMAAGLADHVWSMAEWLTFPAVQHS